MTQGTIATLADLDSLLGTDLLDVADLPEMRVPPVGRYLLSLSTSTKESGAHPQVILTYTVVEVKEQVNAEETPAKVGDLFSVNYNVDNEFGLGTLKRDLKPFAEFFQQTNFGELLQSMEGIMLEGTVKQREDKKSLDDNGKPRVYGSVVNVAIQ